ncbi:uncharacterized protein LOC125090015 isoform X2 [Lutra lutra]|uniref:uncharacterized protein LOC125090015 isoform X2 n=1 Tax=Lutra lutra TaxID=9657 RepID=UPI001FD47E4A|nr:uncharacterized protein LOC125090015 isoform X2 [Lutra lutra]
MRQPVCAEGGVLPGCLLWLLPSQGGCGPHVRMPHPAWLLTSEGKSSRRHDVVYSLPNDRRSVNSRCRVSFYMSPRARVEAVAPSALLFIDKFAFHHHAAEFPQIFADTWRFFISSVITLLASLPRSGPAGGNNSCWGFRVPQKPHLISALQGLLSPKSRKTLLHSRQERTI